MSIFNYFKMWRREKRCAIVWRGRWLLMKSCRGVKNNTTWFHNSSLFKGHVRCAIGQFGQIEETWVLKTNKVELLEGGFDGNEDVKRTKWTKYEGMLMPFYSPVVCMLAPNYSAPYSWPDPTEYPPSSRSSARWSRSPLRPLFQRPVLSVSPVWCPAPPRRTSSSSRKGWPS